jgi:NDP-sugar pyrophosphorylase family protein
VALGLFDVPDVPGSDYLSLDDAGRIQEFHIKPVHPPSSWIWGAAAARVRALEGLDQVEWPSQHMATVNARGELAAIPLSDSYVDIGTPQSLRDAPEAWPAQSS